jgi:hypothetical protein
MGFRRVTRPCLAPIMGIFPYSGAISLMNDSIGNDDQDPRWPVYLWSARKSRDNSAQGRNHQAIERSIVEAVVCDFDSAHARCIIEALQQTCLVKVEHLLL